MLPTPSFERRLRAGRRLVYDVDDAIWFDGPEAQGHALAFMKGSERKATWLARNADHVVAGSDVLADWLSRHTRELTVVPSLVETRGVPVRQHRESTEVVIGWIGSRTTAAYVSRLTEALEHVAARRPELTFKLVMLGGAVPSVRGVGAVTHPWSEEAERDLLSHMDIGIMPLPDNRWTRGKCAYKAIQYMASGVPVVADAVGVTSTVIGDGGRSVGSESEWVDALTELADSPSLRAELGAAGRRRAEQSFSVAAWAPTLARVLKGE